MEQRHLGGPGRDQDLARRDRGFPRRHQGFPPFHQTVPESHRPMARRPPAIPESDQGFAERHRTMERRQVGGPGRAQGYLRQITSILCRTTGFLRQTTSPETQKCPFLTFWPPERPPRAWTEDRNGPGCRSVPTGGTASPTRLAGWPRARAGPSRGISTRWPAEVALLTRAGASVVQDVICDGHDVDSAAEHRAHHQAEHRQLDPDGELRAGWGEEEQGKYTHRQQ